MAWTVTTYQTGQLISQVELNYLRDNLTQLGTHAHAAAVGSGAGGSNIGPLSMATFVANRVLGNPSGGNIAVGFWGTVLTWAQVTGSYLAANQTHTHAVL